MVGVLLQGRYRRDPVPRGQCRSGAPPYLPARRQRIPSSGAKMDSACGHRAVIGPSGKLALVLDRATCPSRGRAPFLQRLRCKRLPDRRRRRARS